MKIKDIISQGVAYYKVKKIDFNVSRNDYIDYDQFIESIDKLKADLTNSNDDYNNILFLMLSDKYLINSIKDNYNSGFNITDSVKKAIDVYRDALTKCNNDYMNQRVIDLDNLEFIILSSLDNYSHPKLEEDVIIVTDELYPSYLIDNIKHIKGIVALRGGNLSHTAILSRANRIPYILVDELSIDYNLMYSIDTFNNIIDTNPLNINDYNSNDNIYEVTKNTNIKILANVFSNDEIPSVVKYQFDGIGLYRTEFIFMNSIRPLDTDMQQAIYEEAANALHPKPVIFRTFDVGDDKNISYLKIKGKGVSNYINNIDIFKSQIKALVKANKNGNIQIMFPMIRSINEFNILKNIVINIAHEYQMRIPKIGMMLETKEALHNILDFKDVDFISLGTNDLTKELYNISREDIKRKELYYKDLLKEINKVIEFSNKYNIKLSICGEIAALGDVFNDLTNMGITNFSVSTECFRAILTELSKK